MVRGKDGFHTGDMMRILGARIWVNWKTYGGKAAIGDCVRDGCRQRVGSGVLLGGMGELGDDGRGQVSGREFL